jgi:hypothetical protein
VEIPKSLKTTWDKVSKDKSISVADYDALINAAAPNGNDSELKEDEVDFLTSLKNQLETHNVQNGPVALSEISFVDEKSTDFCYTAKTIKEFKDAFKGSVLEGKIPVLEPVKAEIIAEAFGEKSVKGLQHKVNAREDGKFGPETYAKSKDYVEQEKSKLNKMSEALNINKP